MVRELPASMLLYMVITKLRKQTIDMRCVDTIAMYLFYIFVSTSAGNARPHHRVYEADESFRSLNFLVHTQLYIPHISSDLSRHAHSDRPAGHHAGDETPRKLCVTEFYVVAGCLTMIGIFCHALETSSSAASCSQRAFSGYTTSRWPWSREKACW